MSKSIKGRVIANSTAVLLARVQTQSGAYLTNALVSSISVNVYNADTEALAVTLNSAATVYDTLQLDNRWTQDAQGYNLAITIPNSAWTTEGDYRIEAKVTPATGTPFFVLFDLRATETLGS